MAYDEATAERVRHLLAERHDVHERKMFGGLAFVVKGGMCCAVSGRGGMLVRVDPTAQPRLIAEPNVRPMVMGGRSVKTFVRVMPEAYRTHAGLKTWVRRGLAAVAALEARSSAHKGSRPARPKRQRTT
ncbi:MAG: TfoX/Sxy family protein [Proteobacteria bacterium]|nr:TfoX/Sxy family protein [Pseudomonadota bacterium]